MSNVEADQKIQEYVAFLESTLRPDHDKARALAEQVRAEIEDYRLLHQQLQQRDQSTAAVDLGFGVLKCEAAPNDSNSILLHIGMGFHVDLTFDEAVFAIQQRLRYLESHFETRQAQADTISEHITSTEEILSKLSRLRTFS